MTASGNSSIALTAFIILTSVYIIVEFYDRYNNTSSYNKNNMFLYGYLLAVVLLEFGMNLIVSDNICNEIQLRSAIIATILSWGIIFVPFVSLLTVMPGWLAPFANTFGQGVAYLYGVGDVLDELFAKPTSGGNTEEATTAELNKALMRIASDRTILANEVTPENFDMFVKTMASAFASGHDTTKFKKIVGLKYAVAKFVWYILLGILATSMSYNYLLITACNTSASAARRKTFEIDLKNEQDKENRSSKNKGKKSSKNDNTFMESVGNFFSNNKDDVGKRYNKITN